MNFRALWITELPDHSRVVPVLPPRSKPILLKESIFRHPRQKNRPTFQMCPTYSSLPEASMSENTFSLEQILESVNEMRTELRECIEPGSTTEKFVDVDADMWQAPEERWFEDCEFDPR